VNEEAAGPESGDDSRREGEERSFREAARSVETGAARASTLPERLLHLPERERAQQLDLKKIFADQEHDLRQRYANWILGILAAQLLVAGTQSSSCSPGLARTGICQPV
jgi:hypothetical protein